jgi:hypothetical protein
MYINQLIMGIQLCYTITSIRELFLFALFYPFFLFFSFLFNFVTSFYSFPLLYSKKQRRPRAEKFPSKRPSTGADFLSLFYFSSPFVSY